MSPWPDFAIRPATPDDDAFLYQLYASTREAELSSAGFAADQRAQFCQMQFRFRQQHYGLHFAHANDRILLWSGVPIGRELITRDADSLTLTDIALLPGFQNCGIGSFLLQALIAESQAVQKQICLHVDQASRAKALYERHGFTVTHDQLPNFKMNRIPIKS